MPNDKRDEHLSVSSGNTGAETHVRLETNNLMGSFAMTCCLTIITGFLYASSAAAAEEGQTVLALDLYTGGKIEGWVVDHNDHGVVLVNQNTPYVVAWKEVTPDCAVGSRFKIVAAARGGRDHVTADDYLQLGLYALSRHKNARATALFRSAEELDPDLADGVRQAIAEYRRKQSEPTNIAAAPLTRRDDSEPVSSVADGEAIDPAGASGDLLGDAGALAATPDEVRARVTDIYHTFGRKVQEVLGERVKLVETDHFLIWTDWPAPFHERLVHSCETMYAALCRVFGISTAEQVFLAKCPLFCFESKARFLRFARSFDGFDGKEAIGYTRSIERNGHVHVVLLRRGRAEEDFERFEYTLVHEGTHAFLHRLYSPRLIPNWVNEGLAEFMSDQVLGERCPARGNAELLAAQYVRHDWPVAPLLASVEPIGVHQYAIAHSLIAFLAGMKEGSLRGMIRRLKAGDGFAEALSAEFGGMTVSQFEHRWRERARKGAEGGI